jgi:hypothetical protein
MGTKRPHCRCDWDARVRKEGDRLGFEVLAWDPYPAKRSKVLIRCKHKEQWVFPQGQLNKRHCCKVASKLALNNPAHGVPSWNSGTVGISTGHGFGGHPNPEERVLPGNLYLIRYLDDTGTHVKLGITRRSIRERFPGERLISILALHTSTLGECFDIEQDCLRYCKQQGWRYSSPTTTELIHPDGLPYLLGRFADLHLS